MKVLIVPMAALAETAGPRRRAAALAKALAGAGIEAATCAAIDFNFKPLPGISNYQLAVPMPMGMPSFIAKRTFPIAQKLGVTSRKTVSSFEEVLFLTGNIAYPYLKKSVGDISAAINEYDPDIVYSEFNISAIIAAKLENRRLYATVSLPTQPSYASSPRFSAGVRRLLREYGLPSVDSCLELFSRADRRFVPSIPELEPFEDAVEYCGVWQSSAQTVPGPAQGNKILVYMGSGTISPRRALAVISPAFADRECEIYFSDRAFPENTQTKGRAVIHTAPFFDFGKLLPESAIFINHGGQNSVADGLAHGVPQIICPGKVFERIYNARSAEAAGAGVTLPYDRFTAEDIAAAADTLLSDNSFREKAAALGNRLLSLGGTDNVLNAVRADVFSEK